MWNKVCSGLFNSGKKYLFWPLKIAAISIFLFTLLVHLLFVMSIYVSFYIRIISKSIYIVNGIPHLTAKNKRGTDNFS